MPRPPVRPPRLQGTVFRGSAAGRAGLLIRHQVQSSAWRRAFPDVYACASLDLTHELRAGAATSLLVPGAVACGRTAAVLWGVGLATPDDDDDDECTVPRTSGVVLSPASA
ncbi:hypothetical protein [Blastococcus sp. SYSU DS0973]